MTTSVLVTGGAGFVGSSLVRRLLEAGYDVVVLDNLLRGSFDNLPVDDRLTFVEGDIRSENDLDRAMSGNPTTVFHLAAQHFIPYCNEHPGDTIDVNVFGTQSVLDAAKANGRVEKIVFASTAAVYGPSDEAHNENETMAPIDIYGISKMQGEQLTEFFHRQTDISVVNARLFNVIGPRETNPHLLPDILDQLPTTSPLKLGNLVPKRDYILTDDVATGLIVLMKSSLDFKNVNIGTGKSYSASELVAAIGDVLGTDLGIESVPERQRAGDRPNLCANNGMLQSLGWRCQNDLHSSISRVLASADLV